MRAICTANGQIICGFGHSHMLKNLIENGQSSVNAVAATATIAVVAAPFSTSEKHEIKYDKSTNK